MNIRGRVLVVDDDPNQRMSLESILALDYEVTTADGVAEARIKMDKGPFEVIVTDYEMPDGTGAELLRLIEARKLATSCILLTGHSDYSAVRDLQKSGKALVLFKPVDPVELLAWIKNGVTMAKLSQAASSLQARTGAPPPSGRFKAMKDTPPGEARP